MGFDASRFAFNPWNNFAAVVMQQGRVQLDSDWNEWLAIVDRRIQAGTLDTMGRAVYPTTTPYGFLIKANQSGGQNVITIGAGRMYVDGLLADNHGPAENAQWDPALAELSGAPQVSPPPEVDLDFTKQPYLPGATLPPGNGPFMVYLDVWQRDVTYLEDPDLIEKAVGVDTDGRIQTVWQVKLLDVSTVSGGVTCSTSIPAWDALLQAPAARLSAGIVPTGTPGPCCLTPTTGYTGTENQLYRVEIHQGGTANPSGTTSTPSATFKWSRDNASVATRVTAINPSTTKLSGIPTSELTVESTGRDTVLGFKPGDWIEITDDSRELGGKVGDLLQIDVDGVDNTNKTIRLTAPVSADIQTNLTSPPANYPDCHTRLQRWDQNGKVFHSDGTTIWVDLGAPGSTGEIPVPPPGTELILEDGVKVAFDLSPAAGSFRVGDYWNFAARTSDGSVEPLAQAPPRGIHHHYARLAVVTFPNAASDCRIPWPSPAPGAGKACGCTACVELADYEGNSNAINAAIDTVSSAGGGRVCLGPGIFQLTSSVVMSGVRDVILSGQGPATVLAYTGSDAAISISNGMSLQIDDLSIVALASIATAAGAGPSRPIGILVNNCAGLAVERCGIAVPTVGAAPRFSIPAASRDAPGIAAAPATAAEAREAPVSAIPFPIETRAGDAESYARFAAAAVPALGGAAIALDGFVTEAAIRDNFMIADIGVGSLNLLAATRSARAAAAPAPSFLVLTGCAVTDNLMICPFAGVALGDVTRQQGYCLYLLENAIDGNTVLLAALGIFVEGLTDPGASVRINGNDLEVNTYGIVTALDTAIIADNTITQADVAQLLRGTAATAGIGIYVLGVIEYPLPVFEVRLHRNRIAAIAGPGIVLDAPAVVMSVTDNTVQGTIGDGMAIGPSALMADLLIRGNEVLAVSGPAAEGSPGVSGIAAGSAFNAVVADNTIGLINNAEGASGNSLGIFISSVVTGAATANNIRDVGPTDRAAGAGLGIAAISVLDDLSVSGNVIHQATSHAAVPGLFVGIGVWIAAGRAGMTGAAAPSEGDVTVSVQDNAVEASSSWWLIYVQGAGDCVAAGNRCRYVPAGSEAIGSGNPMVLIESGTAIASNNRIQGPKGRTGLQVAVTLSGTGGGQGTNPAATLLGNIVSEAIWLGSSPLSPGSVWAPLNIIM